MNTKSRVRTKKAIRSITGHISFGDMLRFFRESRELTQVEMAEMLSISKQDLCNIEKGRKLLSVERAVNFANALEMPPKTFAKYALQDQLIKAGINGEVKINDMA